MKNQAAIGKEVRTRPVRFLLADDNDELRRTVETLLNAHSDWIVVASVSNGREAIEESVRIVPDIVILDWRMPELDGISALPEIRKAVPETRIIMLSAFDDPITKRIALDSGAQAYVVKSKAAVDLISAVELAIHHRASHHKASSPNKATQISGNVGK